MNRHLLTAAVSPLLLFSAEAAIACGIHPAPMALIHSALPTPLPAGTIIAEVEAAPDEPQGMMSYGMRVRVRRMIQGDASLVLILRKRLSSCDDVFGNGRTGFIIAVPIGNSEGIPVVSPFFVHRSVGYRLGDGFHIAPPGPRDESVIYIEN
jgi:ABC-type thiamin/hydroxymethylpyrimidine transport system permease subunit